MTKTLSILCLAICWPLVRMVAQMPGGTPEAKPLVVAFSRPGGFYAQPVALTLAAESVPIFYTTDGSKPTERARRYDGQPILIEKTTVVRAFARQGEVQSMVFTQTFFIGEPPTDLPIVSVAIAPAILFDPENGIMRAGPEADLSRADMPGANFWTRKEFACNVEIFEADKRRVHNSPAGFRIFGGYSRTFPQKSVVLVARKKYGKKYFKHPVFGKGEGGKFKYLVLRNGGSDCAGAHFRDELMSALTDDWDIEKQAHRPALLYLNGSYWGIYHIREKINARFLQENADVDKDSLDLIEHKQTVREGSLRSYRRLLDFIEKHDLAAPENYARVQAMMDVPNFCDHQIAQIYCHNTDAGGNIRFWRPHRPGAKWRWILFDTDWGFGLHDPAAWRQNSLAFFTEADGPDWPNPPWSTFLLRNLLKNTEFRDFFVNRLCDRLNTSFSAENVLAEIAHFENQLAPEMPRHLERWKLSEAEWRRNLNVLRNFATKRPDVLRKFMAEMFDTGKPAGLEVLAASGGTVWINNCVSVENKDFRGRYFENLPVHLQAVPDFGFKFVGWEGIEPQGRAVTLQLRAGATLRLRPRFEPYQHPLHDQIYFNEICAFNKKTGDWLELVNGSAQTVRLEGWRLTDHRHEFAFPDVKILPGQHLVVCQDTAAFRQQFPHLQAIVGNFGFGLDKAADRLALFASDGAAVDSVAYRVEPTDAAYTIDLLLPSLDNAQNDNWSVRPGNGSPGEANPFFLAQMVAAQKDWWVRVGLGTALGLVLLAALWWRRRGNLGN